MLDQDVPQTGEDPSLARDSDRVGEVDLDAGWCSPPAARQRRSSAADSAAYTLIDVRRRRMSNLADGP